MNLRPFALGLALALTTCGANHPAFAQAGPPGAVCGSYRELAQTLRQRFGETARFVAEESRGFTLEVFARNGGGWTLVMRRGDEACAIAAGPAWRAPAVNAF